MKEVKRSLIFFAITLIIALSIATGLASAVIEFVGSLTMKDINIIDMGLWEYKESIEQALVKLVVLRFLVVLILNALAVYLTVRITLAETEVTKTKRETLKRGLMLVGFGVLAISYLFNGITDVFNLYLFSYYLVMASITLVIINFSFNKYIKM